MSRNGDRWTAGSERKVINVIAGLKEPQGVGYVPSSDTLYIASAGDGSVRVFKAGNYEPAWQIDLGDDADNEFLFVEHLGHWLHSPLRLAFDNGAEKDIGVVIADESGRRVEIDRAPIPALRDDPGDTQRFQLGLGLFAIEIRDRVADVVDHRLRFR
jgi:hypothetical protein